MGSHQLHCGKSGPTLWDMTDEHPHSGLLCHRKVIIKRGEKIKPEIKAKLSVCGEVWTPADNKLGQINTKKSKIIP